MSFLQRRKRSAKEHFVVSHFDAYQDGTLAETESAVYEQHLRSCDECREWVQRQDNLVAQLEMEMVPAAVLEPASAARIQQDLYNSMRRAVIMNNVRTSVAAVGALAVLALMVGTVAWWQSSSFGAGVQAPTTGEVPALTLSSLDTLNEQVIKAIGQGDAVMLAAALDEGADPNTQSAPGRSALYLAARQGNSVAIRLLIDAGADIHVDAVNGPVLITAAFEGQREIVEMLLDTGAEINATGSLWDDDETTALMAAADRGHLDVVELLVERGATVNQLNSHGEFALHSAAAGGHPEVVRLLLENGADIDHQTKKAYEIWAAGSSALHLAAHMGFGSRDNKLEVARILIEHGAELNLEDEEGRTPLDIAGSKTEMAALLRAAGAQGSAE
jgi:ankyrin repeat protein